MASNDQAADLRGEMVNLLLQKIAAERHPSATQMNMLESLLTADDLPAYAGVLMDKIQTEKYPSTTMIRRLMALIT
jgi:hypothetical protein